MAKHHARSQCGPGLVNINIFCQTQFLSEVFWTAESFPKERRIGPKVSLHFRIGCITILCLRVPFFWTLKGRAGTCTTCVAQLLTDFLTHRRRMPMVWMVLEPGAFARGEGWVKGRRGADLFPGKRAHVRRFWRRFPSFGVIFCGKGKEGGWGLGGGWVTLGTCYVLAALDVCKEYSSQRRARIPVRRLF